MHNKFDFLEEKVAKQKKQLEAQQQKMIEQISIDSKAETTKAQMKVMMAMEAKLKNFGTVTIQNVDKPDGVETLDMVDYIMG